MKWKRGMSWRIGVPIENCFQPQHCFAPANPAALRPGIGDGLTVLAIDRQLHRNITDCWWRGKFYYLRHRASPGVFTSVLLVDWLREAATDPESPISLRQPSNGKSIDSEGLDDDFLVALTDSVWS